VQVLRRLRVPGIHEDGEVGVFGEQGHLALGVPPVGTVRVGVDELPDGEPVGRFAAGYREMDTHSDRSSRGCATADERWEAGSQPP